MIAQCEQAYRLVVVIGEDGAAVAIPAERLGGIEARRRVSGKRADLAPIEARAETLGSVADHEHAVRLGDLADRVVVRRLTVEVDRDHATRLEPALPGLADRGFEALYIHVECIAANIDEDRRGAREHHHLDGGHEGEGRHEHRIALADALGHQRQEQRVGAVGARHAMLRAAERSKLPFELGDLGSEDELAMLQHGGDRFLDAIAEMGLLCREVDKGRDGLRAVFTHAISHQSASAHSSKGSGQCGIGAKRRQASIFLNFGQFPQSSCRPRRRLP